MRMYKIIRYISISLILYGPVNLLQGAVDNGNFSQDERYYLAALRSFHGGHWANASKWFEKLLKESPDFNKRPITVLFLGQSLYKQEKVKEAYGILTNNQNSAGQYADEYVYWMAECRLKLGNFDAADQHFNELIRNYPNSKRILEATVGSALIAAEREDWAKVIVLLQRKDGVFQMNADRGFDSIVLQEGGLILAKAMVEQKDGESAELLLGKLPKEIHLERGWRRSLLLTEIYIFNGKSREAINEITQLRKVLKQAKASPSWHLGASIKHAQILEKRGDYFLAADIYMDLLAGNSHKSIKTYASLSAAQLYKKSKDLVAAAAALKQLQESTEDDYMLALSYFLSGEIELERNRPNSPSAAIKFYEKASEYNVLGDLGARIHMRIGECHSWSGSLEKANAQFHKGMGLSDMPIISARMKYLDGLVKAKSGKTADAIKSFSSIKTIIASDNDDTKYIKDYANLMWFKYAIGQMDLVAAESLLKEARENSSSMLPYYLLGISQVRITTGEFELADEILVNFKNQNPDEELVAVAELEHIRLQVMGKNWPEVIRLYDRWLQDYPDHGMKEKVQLDRAWALMRSGRKGDAVKAFKRLSSRKITSAEVYTAKIWLADQYFNSSTNRLEAEKIYQELASETNCPPSLRYRSQLMAGRAAMIRQGYDDAKKSFVTLLDNPDVSEPERIQATFALGDLIMFELKASPVNSPEAEKIQNERIYQSTNILFGLTQIVKTNIVAARAWGRIGDICLMTAREREHYYDFAKTAYEQSKSISEQSLNTISGPSDFDGIMNQALMGLVYCAERSTVSKNVEIRRAALQNALMTIIDVYENSYGDPKKKIDLYWRGQSGIVAIRLMTELEKYNDAIQKCIEMEILFPGMKEYFRAKKQRLEALRDGEP